MGLLDEAKAIDDLERISAYNLKVRHEMSFLNLYQVAKNAVKGEQFSLNGIVTVTFQFYGEKRHGFKSSNHAHGVYFKETKHLELTAALHKLTIHWVR